ncbi:hypothetical protein JCM19000A_39110 [Silvimonas sp. JCM 19000]
MRKRRSQLREAAWALTSLSASSVMMVLRRQTKLPYGERAGRAQQHSAAELSARRPGALCQHVPRRRSARAHNVAARAVQTAAVRGNKAARTSSGGKGRAK